MPFDREPTRTPTTITRLTLHVAAMRVGAAQLIGYDKGTAEVGISFSDGSHVVKTVNDLEAQLSGPQKTAVKNLLDALWARAEAEIL